MKNSIFSKRTRKIFFALGCLVLAFVFWFVVKYNLLGASPIFTLSFS